jgi:anti-sigma regulatory factor (Ser/Thr protein kinase)
VGSRVPERFDRGESRLDLRVLASPKEVAGVRAALGSLEMPERMLDVAALLVTELLSNSIKHAGLGPEDEIRLTADWSGQRLRITVRDRPSSSALPPVTGSIRPPAEAESGWGLYLIDQLASRWGRLEDAAGAGFWFELEPET